VRSLSENPLIELIHGKGAHVSPLACVEDLSAELAGSNVSGFPHSVWQILKHLNYWMDYELNRIDGRAAPYPVSAAASWPRSAVAAAASGTAASAGCASLGPYLRETADLRCTDRQPLRTEARA